MEDILIGKNNDLRSAAFEKFHAGTRKSLSDFWLPVLEQPIKFILIIEFSDFEPCLNFLLKQQIKLELNGKSPVSLCISNIVGVIGLLNSVLLYPKQINNNIVDCPKAINTRNRSVLLPIIG